MFRVFGELGFRVFIGVHNSGCSGCSGCLVWEVVWGSVGPEM